jgi:hypothetical protein
MKVVNSPKDSPICKERANKATEKKRKPTDEKKEKKRPSEMATDTTNLSNLKAKTIK